MLLAVEGGGFFSSSASGYSNGLALLLLGRKNEDKPVKISPWNQYRLVEREEEREREKDYQLASSKNTQNQNQVTCKCTPFVCFSCTPSGNLEAEPASQCDNTHKSLSGSVKGKLVNSEGVVSKRGCLKSNLKRDSSERCMMIVSDTEIDARESVEEGQNGNFGIERRKVQWTDTCGKDLVEIREFEVSDAGASDDELEHESFRRCECVIQ